jgi:cobalamin biosynthesis Mg chelatase CobN
VMLSDGQAPDLQSALASLQGQSGPAFDQSWLQVVQGQQQKALAAAQALLNSPDATPDAKAAAQAALNALQSGQTQAQAAADATSSAGSGNAAGSGSGSASASGKGSGTPSGVNAGTGGQAAEASQESDLLPAALVGLGIALIAGAGWWLRRHPSGRGR